MKPFFEKFKTIKNEREAMIARFSRLDEEYREAYYMMAQGHHANDLWKDTPHKNAALYRKVAQTMLEPDERDLELAEKRALLSGIFWRYLARC